MSEFFLRNVRAGACRGKHSRCEQQSSAEMQRSGKTFKKLRTSNGNGARETQFRPSRATSLLLAQRLRDIREEKGLSQSDISGRMALRRTYISRVENAEHMPALRILQRWARALEVPLYQLFYDGKTPLVQLRLFQLEATTESSANSTHDPYFHKLQRLLPRLSESNRKLLLELAQTIRGRGPRGPSLGHRRVIPRAIAR